MNSSAATAPASNGVRPLSLADLLDRARARRFPLIMGVLNVTPDSFSDGGRYLDPERAIDHTRQLIAEGADVIDVGAESTRPYGGSKPVDAAEELARLKDVLPPVVALGTPVSIDTMKADVADWALRCGATIANDVWGLQRDPAMVEVVAAHNCPVIIMRNGDCTTVPDIITETRRFFERSLDIAAHAGIERENIVLDPGIGFGVTPEQSAALISHLREFASFGLPLLVGASRKRFIDKFSPAPPDRRLGGSIAAHLLAAQNGAAIIRAHDVAETVQAFKIAAAIGFER
jgi:dihydropteroate synthase